MWVSKVLLLPNGHVEAFSNSGDRIPDLCGPRDKVWAQIKAASRPETTYGGVGGCSQDDDDDGRTNSMPKGDIGRVKPEILTALNLAIPADHLDTYNAVEKYLEDYPEAGSNKATYEVSQTVNKPTAAVKYVHQRIREQLLGLPIDKVRPFQVNYVEPAPPPKKVVLPAGPAAATPTPVAPQKPSPVVELPREEEEEQITMDNSKAQGEGESAEMWRLMERMMEIASRVSHKADAAHDVIREAIGHLKEMEPKPALKALEEYMQKVEGKKHGQE